ncbi:MAG: NAD-dependent epimerase/dehydratase family protein, partial [Candidatus Delongbacteria bacterium]|nr:NAD-dependent epimerase/dehydratase family protein [Candidatus Delongbacteria bacterium]
MKILILGGTLFLGKHIVGSALRDGHEVTLFNRGNHPELYPEVEKLVGDRDSELDILKGRKWDVVIDTCGYIPRIVEKSAEVLADNVDLYVFISTISVYKDFSKPGITELSELATLEDESDETLNNETYGALKTHCEERVMKHFPENNLIIRPGLIVGPDDYTDRFTYWPVRIQKGFDIIIPENTNYPVQFIDVRDLADFTLKMSENKATGVFNATGPEKRLSFKEFLDHCFPFAEVDIDIDLVKIPEQFLEDSLAEYKAGLPMLEAKGEWAGIEQVDCSKAIDAGLIFRPLSSTIIDTLIWFQSLPKDREMF